MPTPFPSDSPTQARLAGAAALAPPRPRPPKDGRRRWAAPLVALALLGLGGCKLIDQTTFAPAPPAAPVQSAPTPTPKVATHIPLLTIGPNTPVSGYQTLLGFAVHAAEQRDRDVRFDVTAVAPAGLPPARQTEETTAAEAEATRVMQAIAGTGVPADRILLRAVLDPAATQREVRVYVR